MGVTKKLYQLQEVDLGLESDEQALKQMVSQLGESQELVGAQDKLTSEQQRLDDLKHQQHSVEWRVDDLVNKISAVEEQLYSGRIKNPKELTNLQREDEILRTGRDQLENKALAIMDQIELAEASVIAANSELEKLEAEWRSQQQRLLVDIEALKSRIGDLGQKRQLLSAKINPQAVEVYDKLRNQKGQAVAKVEQGVCRVCRISLPFGMLQQARVGDLAQCGSCGRILFLP
jgi:hypothetical protein